MSLKYAIAAMELATALLIAACGGDKKLNSGDGPMDAFDTCDPLAQTRCNAGEKCTWIYDAVTPTLLGHVGCVQDGAAALGEACGFGQPGPMGFDDCGKGNLCVSGRCRQICDQSGGAPTCGANFACESYSNLFNVNSMTVAGVCDPVCDPLKDNDFDGSGSASTKQPNSPCLANQGCYGAPGNNRATVFTCSVGGDATLTHRAKCTVENGCLADSTHVFTNGCAPGYVPLLKESTGSSEAVCVAYCKPQDCYQGNCANGRIGAAGFSCKSDPALGTFSATEECAYSWIFERDRTGRYIPSPTSDTVGFCIDHAKYTYGSAANPPAWPACDSLPIGDTVMGGFDATFFGCVSTKTATTQGNPPFAAAAAAAQRLPMIDLPRAPYNPVVRASVVELQ